MKKKKKKPEELNNSMTYAGSKRLSVQHNTTFSIASTKEVNGELLVEITI